MNPLPPLAPLPRDQRKIDADHLKLLSIFHFICSGLALLGVLFLLLHFAIMHTVFENPQMWQHQKSGPPPAVFFSFLKVFYLVFGLWFLLSCVLNIISGLCLAFRTGRTFSLVVAGLNCVHIPLGTTFGVFTFVVLLRDSVRELYETKSRV